MTDEPEDIPEAQEVAEVVDVLEVTDTPEVPEVPEIADTTDDSELVESAPTDTHSGESGLQEDSTRPLDSEFTSVEKEQEEAEPVDRSEIQAEAKPENDSTDGHAQIASDQINEAVSENILQDASDNSQNATAQLESDRSAHNQQLIENRELDSESLKKDAAEATYERVPEPKDFESKGSRKHYYEDLSGTMGEELTIRNIGGASLDSMVKENCEVLDATTPSEMASVKSRIVGKVSSAISNYARDLRDSLGFVEQEKFDKMVQTIWDTKENPDQWEVLQESLPEDVRNAASAEEMAEAIKENTTLRIPSDHVEKVHKYLDRVVEKNPELYGIPKDLPSEEYNQRLIELKDRVRPIADGVTSQDMRNMSRELFQQRLNDTPITIHPGKPPEGESTPEPQPVTIPGPEGGKAKLPKGQHSVGLERGG